MLSYGGHVFQSLCISVVAPFLTKQIECNSFIYLLGMPRTMFVSQLDQARRHYGHGSVMLLLLFLLLFNCVCTQARLGTRGSRSALSSFSPSHKSCCSMSYPHTYLTSRGIKPVDSPRHLIFQAMFSFWL